MRFSVIVVCLNPGEKLNQTLESILFQTCTDYEIIIKDGGSRDGSIEGLQKSIGDLESRNIRLYVERDSGIYDAMNQAVSYAEGEYLIFMNCGDAFFDKEVLEKIDGYIRQEEDTDTPLLLYGNTCSVKNHTVITSPPKITGFTCYRNIPCHQSCVYAARLCKEKSYDLQYKIRADYDHFLWCYYEAQAKMVKMDITAASYEGGGFSESKENLKRDREEHKRITAAYMKKGEIFKYQLLLWCTLAPLRRWMAESLVFSGIYHWIKERIYYRKKWCIAGVLLFIMEVMLLIWPIGLAKEDTVHFLAGEGMWLEEMPQDGQKVCQEFIPQYTHLKSIGFFLSMEEEEVPAGSVNLTITDKKGQLLWEKKIPYAQVNFGQYTDIAVNLEVHSGKTYMFMMEGYTEPFSKEPMIGVCGKEQPLKENKTLFCSEEWAGVQILARYYYTDTMPVGKAVGILVLGLITMLGLCLGLPGSPRMKKRVGILLFLLAPLVLGRNLELLSVNPGFLQPKAMFWNIGMMYLMEVTVLFLSCSLKYSIIVTNLFLTILYTVNHYVYQFRGVALRLNDLAVMDTALKVAGEYSLRPDAATAMVWAVLFLFLVYAIAIGASSPKTEQGHIKIKRRLLSVLAGLILFGSSAYLFIYTDLLESQGFEEVGGVNQQMTYQYYGYLVSSCLDIQNSQIKKVEGYSTKLVESILKNAKERNKEGDNASEERPHVILIMNESYTDLRVLGNLQISEENMNVFYGLKDNAIHGYVNVSGLGGSTANSEFEVLTGCSMGLLPDSYYPYQQCFTRPLPSLVSHMKDAGYTTYSMHPENKYNYNRGVAYEKLGFDYSFWLEEFNGAETLHAGVSDRETYHKIEEIFENRKEGEKLFIFDVTMQNHGGYTSSDVERTISSLNAPCEEADVFLSLIQESDEALGEMIRYFEQQDEEVLICMFGDHQPLFIEEDFYDDIYKQTANLTDVDKLMNQYKTPFVIWANFEMPESGGLDISTNYLGVLLQETAGVPLSPYFAFLEELAQEYPIITAHGCMDSNGNYQGIEGLEDYQMLQYRYLFDMKDLEWGY